MDFKERYQYDPKKDLIGRGGFSIVYKAWDRQMEREVALKFFKDEDLHGYDVLNEIRKVSRLSHPNVIRFFDFKEIEVTDLHGVKSLAQVGIMEFVNNGDIGRFLGQRNYDRSLTLKLLIDVLKGLAYLHANAIIHRDLKPQNILVHHENNDYVAKLVDFGISKHATAHGQSASSRLIGTVEYMAPEQFDLNKYGINQYLTTQVDLWSFGVLVYELITGQSLFKKGLASNPTPEQIMWAILHTDKYKDIGSLPEPFSSLVSKCLVKKASERAQRAMELCDHLEIFLQSPPPPTPSQPDFEPESSPIPLQPDGTHTTPLPYADVIIDSSRNTQPLHPPVPPPQPAPHDPPEPPGFWQAWSPKQQAKLSALGFILGLLIVWVVYRLSGCYQPVQQLSTTDKGRPPIIAPQQEAPAVTKDDVKSKSVLSPLVSIDGGEFTMGSATEADERPAKETRITDFKIAEHETTNDQFATWLNIYNSTTVTSGEFTGKPLFDPEQMDIERNDATGRWEPVPGRKLYPVTGVTWYGAMSFAQYYGGRLPTEAEWEYAAKGGRYTVQARYAGSNNADAVGWVKENAKGSLHPVKGKKTNELGLFDMTGNVFEWCADYYDAKYYGSANRPFVDPAGPPDGEYRVLRGGSFANAAKAAVNTRRNFDRPDVGSKRIGFRMVKK